MIQRAHFVLLNALILGALPAKPAVVINEIFYHAPDDIEDLEYIELYNPDEQTVDLSGWKFTAGLRFQFPQGARILPKGFFVLSRNPIRFKEFYGFAPAATFDHPLSNSGERIELANAKGEKVDTVTYGDSAPWPLGADGYSSSLERISPSTDGAIPENWAASPPSEDEGRPAGSPGKVNASLSLNLPPIVSGVTFTPANPAAGQPVKVEAEVRDADGVSEVKLRYRLAAPGAESAESTLTMTNASAGRFSATLPGQKAKQIVRFCIEATDRKGASRRHPTETEPRPAISYWVHDNLAPGKIPVGLVIQPNPENASSGWRRSNRRGMPGRRGGAPAPPQTRGQSAFVFIDPKTREARLFDFVKIVPRKGGYKVHFHKDRLLDGMSGINLIFEYHDRFVLAEPLAYEVYRLAGNAAPASDFVRLSIDDQPAGYHLLVEQPNRTFLRRHKIKDGGNLYKILWYEDGVVGQHEKKTNRHTGHEDLIDLIGQLENTRGDEQWFVIRKHFNVEQVINYFAVNTCLSHWDGFFNNYFTYHDLAGSNKWEMYPWDQDKTWGFYDGLNDSEVFYDMPLTFGMEGDSPPGSRRNRPSSREFRGGQSWWRHGGYFSRPLLANPQFRRQYLARTKELVETVYTEQTFYPIIDAMGARLAEEVRIRATVTNESPAEASDRLKSNLQSLKDHLKKRRAFLLAQPEIRAAGAFDRTQLR